MKKYSKLILLILSISLITACGGKNETKNEVKKVYSVSGEDGNLTLEGGILVVDENQDTFKGGKIYIKDKNYEELKSYTVKYYYLKDNKELTIMSNASTMEAEEFLNPNGEFTGSISSKDLLKDIENIKDDLYITIDGIDKEDREVYHSMKLELELVHPMDVEKE